MFWALVSPLRHTAEPPRLSPTSRSRLVFQRHGEIVSRHPILAIIISVVFSVILCYPFPFLYNFTPPGYSSVPHHVWTSARPFSNSKGEADIGIKQAWVQGSFMGALKKDVVAEALEIQQKLLGPEAICNSFAEEGYFNPLESGLVRNSQNTSSARPFEMFFHSPLLYWNCSVTNVLRDEDLIHTVNNNYYRHSAANVTLGWGSVFAGKRFYHHRLIAVDALVISLFYRLDSPYGDLWDQRVVALAKEAEDHKKYIIYPSDGKNKSNTMYEFRFQPMSRLDMFTLSACYGFTLIYLTVSLRRLKAVKSRFGLVLTVLTQVTFSVMASFTILAYLEIPVSHIPREVFPFVVMVVGLENMFRLINAVIETPAEQPANVRMATALGEVGFLSTVAVGTDLFILFVVGRFSVPAVREFCTFAAVALIMDFVLHLTYFLAVLSVDVRRLELQDSLERLNLSNAQWERRDSSARQGKLSDIISRGGEGMPTSTRIAGSAIMFCTLVILNMHFLENQSPWRTFLAVYGLIFSPQTMNKIALAATNNLPVNVARTPKSWLKLQDQLTGMELIRAVKPGAHRMVAKVYDPLFVVLRGSNRAASASKSPNAVNMFDMDAIKGHIQGFILTIVIVIAGVTLLMNHLLMKDVREDMSEQPEHDMPLLTTQTLYEGHSLDVVMLAASPRGVIVSVGLDRRIVVWKMKTRRQGVSKDIVRPTCSEHVLWPVIALTIDEKGEWLAIAPRAGMVSFWQVKEATFYRSIKIEMNGQAPSAFFFEPHIHDEQYGPRLIVLRQSGLLSEVCVRAGDILDHRICDGMVVSSSHGVFTPKLPLRIVTACQRGRIFVTAKIAGEWRTEQLNIFAQPIMPSVVGEACTILPLSALGMIVSSRSCNVDLVDLLSGSVVRTFQTGQFKPSSLRAFHANKRTCLHCGCPSVLSFSISYTERESGMFIMHTFSSSRGKMRDICLRAERDRRERKCTGFESVVETTHWLENVEGWEPTNLNMVAGIRRRELLQETESSDDYELTASNSPSLRRRRKVDKKQSSEDEDEWEAWTMNADGIVTPYPLSDKNNEIYDDGLLVSRAGPVTRVGQRSIAVGFGNTVKLLLVGNERYEDDDDDDPYRSFSRKPRNHRR